jgi:hypothetical protein
MAPGFDDQAIEEAFTYHPPQGTQEARYIELREAHKELARKIVELTPGCAEQTTAIRKLEECSMWGNKAIALEPPGSEDLHGEGPTG